MTAKLDADSKNFLNLVLRSPDMGDGWREVSEQVWPLVVSFGHPELLEIESSSNGGRVRLSEDGRIVVRYL